MNPLINEQRAQIPNQMLKGIKDSIEMIKMANNPQIALNLMAQRNPQLQQVIEMCKGRDPKDVFMDQARSMGIDPEEIIKMLM